MLCRRSIAWVGEREATRMVVWVHVNAQGAFPEALLAPDGLARLRLLHGGFLSRQDPSPPDFTLSLPGSRKIFSWQGKRSGLLRNLQRLLQSAPKRYFYLERSESPSSNGSRRPRHMANASLQITTLYTRTNVLLSSFG